MGATIALTARPGAQGCPVAREHGTKESYRFGLTGRSKTNGCRCGLCWEANDLCDRYRAKRLPVQPFVDALHAAGLSLKGFETSTGINIHRHVRARTVDLTNADRLAVTLGMHPVMVWGADWISDEPFAAADLERSA